MFSSLKNFFKRKPPEEAEDKILIWGVLEGPIFREDFPEDLTRDFPDSWQVCLICSVQVGDRVGPLNLWFPNTDTPKYLLSYFYNNIEPLEFD